MIRRVERWTALLTKHPPLWLPALVLLLLTLPSIGRGDGFSPHGFKPDDTAWYSAISLQNWRDFGNGSSYMPGVVLGGQRGYINGAINGMTGTPYFNKPPLAFVIHGFFLWVLGAIPAAARLPSIIAAALTVWVVTLAGARLIGRHGGVTCGLALALTLEFVRHTQAFSLDLWLALWCACAAWAVVRAAEPSGTDNRLIRWMVIAGVFIGLSLMTKPLVGLIMLPIFAAWLAWGGGGEQPRRMWAWLSVGFAALPAAVIVAAPWHVHLALLFGQEFTDQYFGKEIADRAAGSIGNLNQDAANPLYYLAILGKTYWPWLVVCIVGAWTAVRLRMDLSQQSEAGRYVVRARSLMRLGFIASLVWLVLLSIFPDKRPRYLLVAYPFMAMLAGGWIDWAASSGRYVWLSDVRKTLLTWCLPLAVVLGVVLAVADKGKPREKQYDELLAWFAAQPGGVDSAMNSLFTGGFSGQRAAVVYLETARWPIPTRTNAGHPMVEVGPGDDIIYHTRDGFSPGDTEDVVFHSGDITVTRLRERPWEPRLIADPGEK